MPRTFSRSQRVASQVQRELAVILQSDLRDPRLGLITINAVDVSRDLAVAKIYFTLLNGDKKSIDGNQLILEQSAPFIRKLLGKRMRMRNLPELRFMYDASIAQGLRIEELLDDERSDKH